MSRQSVRHGIADYLTKASIPGVGTVFASPPKIARSSDALVGAPPGTPSGSVVFVEVFAEDEKRAALGGPHGGNKDINHAVRLHLLFRSRQRKAEDAADDHDTQLETLLAAIRADRTLGGCVFQAGEGATGIKVDSGLPQDIGSGSIIQWTAVDFDALEIIIS